jgi:ATP-dependent RNA/DNA helicase IGHMBP2
MSHLLDLHAALDRERRAVEQEHARLRALPMPQRVAAGFSLAPLELVDTEYRSRGRVNVLLRGRDLPDSFQAGDPVVLAPIGRPDDGWTGRVEGVDEGTVELRVDGEPEGRGPWAVSRRLDFTVLSLQQAALRQAEDRYSPLKNLLLGYEPPYRPDPLEHRAFAGLHSDQRAAATLALGATEVGLVHGPPGTGKTEVLVRILAALRDLGEQPWALADSNAAVDHLALRAKAAGLDVVRIGVSARIGGAVRPLTLEHRILHGARAAVIQNLLRQVPRVTGPDLAEVRVAIKEEWSAAKREILQSADCVAMTLGTLHTRGADLPAPRTAVVDEAGQTIEPALWLLANRVKRLILAGDPQQLGPVVQSRDPLLERSLLDRLVVAGFHFPMLTEQRRMNTTLMELCQPTYGHRLTAAPEAAARYIAAAGPWTTPAARFLDTAGMALDEARDALGSLYNEGEVNLLRTVWESLRAGGVTPDQVGVIAPYTAQVLRLRSALPELEVGTVNAFQGREKDVILASFVRSNPDGELGFVADPRRLNVAVTRARCLFIGVGDSATLGGHPGFSRLVQAVGDGYISGWEVEVG